jgi:hypothetical protein
MEKFIGKKYEEDGSYTAEYLEFVAEKQQSLWSNLC